VLQKRHVYVPAFDGLRACLILWVVIIHVFLKVTPSGKLHDLIFCGWTTVDCFFALSGFLITWILAEELDRDGTINLPRFYTNRFFRLSPAYISAIAFTSLGQYLSHKPIIPILWILPVYLTYTLNIFAANRLLYNPLPLNQAWSLSIEEQFYFCWPWLLRKLGLRNGLRFAIGAVIAIAIYRSGLYTWLNWGHFWVPSNFSVDRIYECTDTRIDSIFAGCAMCLLIRRQTLQPFWERLKAWRPLATVGILYPALCVVLIAWRGEPSLGSWRAATLGYTIVSTSMAVLVVSLYLQPQGWPSRLLSWKPLVFVGKISYGLYLFHMAIRGIAFRQLHMMDGKLEPLWKTALVFLFVWSASVAVSALHYYLVEQRFMAIRSRFKFAKRRSGPVTVSAEAQGAAADAEPGKAVATG
jgi:peptidoglycan/LPS O-acetylase OafA/YrhL